MTMGMYDDFIDLVRDMRKSQKAFFDSPPGPAKKHHLQQSKSLENKVDKKLQGFKILKQHNENISNKNL